jgi:hypothetical protein
MYKNLFYIVYTTKSSTTVVAESGIRDIDYYAPVEVQVLSALVSIHKPHKCLIVV